MLKRTCRTRDVILEQIVQVDARVGAIAPERAERATHLPRVVLALRRALADDVALTVVRVGEEAVMQVTAVTQSCKKAVGACILTGKLCDNKTT